MGKILRKLRYVDLEEGDVFPRHLNIVHIEAVSRLGEALRVWYLEEESEEDLE